MFLKPLFQKSRRNLFVSLNQIPLGMNSYKGISKMPIISMPYDKYSGAWGFVTKSGGGKTTLVKRVYSYVLGYYQMKYKVLRPGIIFDMQSEDHHLSKFPNSRPFNLFWNQGEFPIGFPNLVNYAPGFIMEESHYFDRPFAFILDDYGTRDFATLGMGAGAAKRLHYLIKSNPGCTDDLAKFYDALETIPTSSVELKRLKSDFLFKLDRYFVASSKLSMLDNFTVAYEDNVFVDKKNEFYKKDFIDELKDGKIIVINFHQEEKYYPLYAGKIMRDIYLKRRAADRKQGGYFPPPVLIIEEADLLAPKGVSDNISSIYWLKQILKRGRKYSFFTIVVTQEASSLHEDIRNHTREWVIGQLADPDIPFFSKYLSSKCMNAILSLDKSRYEFCIVYEDGNFDTFYAWNSPVELKREIAL